MKYPVWSIKAKQSSTDLASQLAIQRGLDNFAKLSLDEIFAILDLNIEDAKALILKHIEAGNDIWIYGDYDADGVCATAIIYKTLKQLLNYERVFTFLPDRFDDGYGLSVSGLNKIKEKSPFGLIITVDCGITALSEVAYVKELGFDILLTDHHKPKDSLPSPDVLVWSDKVCGSFLSFALASSLAPIQEEFLALAAIATVTDLIILDNINRNIVRLGLEILRTDTRNVGLKALIEVSEIKNTITTYEIGWLLGPRLNASGRLESALLSLNLLLASDYMEAHKIAKSLSSVNYERQVLTKKFFEHAKNTFVSDSNVPHLIIAHDTKYHEGLIGLIASKLAQEFHRPTFVLSVGEEFTKGSARSVGDIDLISFLRTFPDFFINLGGHKGAAGFTIKTENLLNFKKTYQDFASETFSDSSLLKVLSIDLEIEAPSLTLETLESLKSAEPYGFGNPEPIFTLLGVEIIENRKIGANQNHLKLKIKKDSCVFNAVFFGAGEYFEMLSPIKLFDIAFTLKENDFNFKKSLDLMVKDIRISNVS